MKKIFFTLSVLICVFTINVNAFALTSSKYHEVMQNLDDFYDKVTVTPSELSQFMSDLLSSVGINIKPYSSGGHAFDNSKKSINDIDSNITSNSSIDDVKTWINQHMVVDNDSITIDNDMRQFINNYYQNYYDDFGSGWVYSGMLSVNGKFTQSWIDAYNNWRSSFTIGRETVLLIKTSSTASENPYIVLIPRQNLYMIYYDDNKPNNNSTCQRYRLGSKTSNNGYLSGSFERYQLDTSVEPWSFKPMSNISISSSNFVYANNGALAVMETNSTNSFWFYSHDQALPDRLPFYKTVDAGIESSNINISNEYRNTDVWNDFSSSSGDWTFSPSNTNTVNYGDTVSYIENYYEDNDYYPDQSVVNQWIGDQNIINNDDGGGSGGSGDGDDDDDDDGGSIFDWLKNLGKVLGDLIKGLGEFLTEIISGLVTALNELLSSLSGLITDTLGSLTNVFSTIIDFVYSGLPESVKGIMMLALTVSLLITVIQLIRK